MNVVRAVILTAAFILLSYAVLSRAKAQERVGVEISQAAPRAISSFDRPAGCPRTLWCGCHMAVRIFGAPRRDLWYAKNWIGVGAPAGGPGIGVIVVSTRGRRGGHVAQIVGGSPGNWIVHSGNFNGRVYEGPYRLKNVIAYRRV